MTSINILKNCLDGLGATEVSKRKKYIKQLRDFLNDLGSIEVLNRYTDQNSELNWTYVFTSVHSLLLKDSIRIRNNETKDTRKPAAVSRYDMEKSELGGIINIVVNKANQEIPRIRCSALVGSIVEVLSNKYLCKTFSPVYIEILRKNMFPFRSYWGAFSEDNWNDLTEILWKLFATAPPYIELAAITDILESVLKYGGPQSFIGLKFKNKFSLLAEKFLDPSFHTSSIGTQGNLIKLATTICTELGKECRMAVCHLGELVLLPIIHLYDNLSKQKELLFKFLLLQVKLHHPFGTSQTEDKVAYAANWKEWNPHLNSLYTLIKAELLRIQNGIQKEESLETNFLQLSVEVCKQVFDSSDNSIQVIQEISLNETLGAPAAKKMKVVAGIQAVMSILQNLKTPHDAWPWLQVLSALTVKYPAVVKEVDFISLLHLIADLLGTCKDIIVMKYLFMCCISLLKVEQHLGNSVINTNVANAIWDRIWETTLRTIGLNQCEQYSHKLVQELITHSKIQTAASDLLILYITGSIKHTEPALATLQFLCHQYQFPHRINVSRGTPAVREALQTWFLPEDITTRPHLNTATIGQILVLLILKINTFSTQRTSNSLIFTNEFEHVVYDVEKNYIMTAFENLPNSTSVSCSQEFDFSVKFVSQPINSDSKCALLEALDRDLVAVQNQSTNSMTCEEKVKFLQDVIYQTELLLHIWSWMISFNVIKTNTPPRFADSLEILLDTLSQVSASVVSYPVGLDWFVESSFHLFDTKFHPYVSNYVREIVPVKILQLLHNLSCKTQIYTRNKEDMDVESDFNAETSNIINFRGLMDSGALNNEENLKLKALKGLCSFCISPDPPQLCDRHTDYLEKIFSLLISEDFIPFSKLHFQMAVYTIKRISGISILPHLYVKQSLKVVQLLCKTWHLDHEAVGIILELLQGLFVHIHGIGQEVDKENTIVLLRGLQQMVCKKKYGPKVLIKLLCCLGHIAKVDKNFSWTLWNFGTKLIFTESKDLTPISEEIVIYLGHDFHELRMTAINFVPNLFAGEKLGSDSQLLDYHTYLFENICKVVMASFVIEGELTEQEKIDECANRSSTALHSMASLIISGSFLRKRALFGLIQLAHEKKISLELVDKVLTVVGNILEIKDIRRILEVNLNYLIIHWNQQKYKLQDFPWSLLRCSSETDFYDKYLATIVPILLYKEDDDTLNEVASKVGKNLPQLIEICYPRIMGCLLPCFSIDCEGDSYTAEVRIAKRLLCKLEEILSKDHLSQLLSKNLDTTIVSTFRLLFDHSKFIELSDCTNSLPEPDPPHFKAAQIVSSLEYLQRNSPEPGSKFFVFLSNNSPGTIQKVMLQFSIDLYTGPTLEDRLKSLHHYLLFANILGSELQNGDLQKVAPYIIRDVLYTLTNLVKTTSQKEEVLAGAVCHFLWLFCKQCVATFSSIIGLFLSNIVSVLIPIISLNSNISFHAKRLLKFLIVENSTNLASAIKNLSPFPVDSIYEDLQLIYKQIMHEGEQNTLEVEIKQFLEACRIINNCQVERLQHLCSQLSAKKDQLCQLYIEQRKLRGFSEDCEKSILHNLIYVLIKQLSSKDESIRMEVSRCLSELGPCDLTTLMIHPGCKEKLDLLNNTNMFLSLTGLIINLFNTSLLDKDIFVVEAASNALYVVMASKEAQFILDKMKSEIPNIEFLTPFFPVKRNKRETVIEINKCLFEQLINRKDLWVPNNECTHALWITNLVCSILTTFVQGKSYFSHLIPICKLKVSVSEKVLPFLIGLLINHEKECEEIIISNMNEFFLRHFQKHANLSKERSISPDISLNSKKEICLNQDSVQCMLNIVHFLREWDTQLLNFGKLEEKVNFLHIAKAAQFCSAYFTSILYAELWCSNYIRSADVNTNSSVLEYIFDVDRGNASVLQNILFEAYIKIGDSDAVYGCGPSQLLDSVTQVHHFELIGKWDRVIQSYDLDISSGIIDSTSGLLFALQRFGLNHILQGYLESRNNHESVIQNYEMEYQYDCAWRLSNWDVPSLSTNQLCERNASYGLKNLSARLYEKYHYTALKCLHDHDVNMLQEALSNARNCIIQYLSHTNLESSKIIYYSLAQLQALQEIEDFSEAYWKENVSLTQVAHKWKQQDDIGYNDFEHIEPILSQRVVMLGIARGKENIADQAQSLYQKLNLEIANRAREEGHFQVAMKCLRAVTCKSSLSHYSSLKLKLEEAKLSWVREDKDIALYILRSVINDPQLEKGELYALALTLYADWLVETKTENPHTIIHQYFLKSVEIVENIIGTSTDFQHLIEAYWSLSNFCDSQYQQLNRYFKSSEFEIKQQYVNKAKADIVRFQSQVSEGTNLAYDERRALNICDRQAKIDSAEISSAQKEMDFYLITAMKYYLKGLEHSDRHDLKVFRFAHLWLENMSHTELNKVIDENLNRIPNHKFIPLLPQLTPRISNASDFFSKKLCSLIEQCAIAHPHHTLSLILSIANAYKDQEFCESNISVKKLEPRVVGAQQLIQKLNKNKHVGTLVQQMQKMSLALISLAYYKPKQNNGAEPIPQSEPLRKLKDLHMIPLQTISIPVHVNGCYDNIIGIAGYEPKFTLVGGINAPKKITCCGTDGVKRPQLIKGKDDLRQDAVMQQVFMMMNTFLQKHKETSKRKLLMRTYKVIPLSKRSGIIEWCQNTEVLGQYLVGSDGKSGAHRKYYPNDLTGVDCKNILKKVASESNEKKLEVFQKICKSFHPVLHNFFLENFVSAGVWFERRLAYIHSVATSSMIGYILGLGDRHVINILLDKNTAEIIHIDFGIAFEMGRILPTPETVPFRLTRDIVDAMGASGVEGVFRRSCEKTMLVLRQNKDIILTILEVLLYDPLYAWSLTPSKAYSMQHSGSAKRGSSHADDEESSAEVNKMAERALLRLQQKLQGMEEGAATSISGQVNHLIQQARDPGNLSRLFLGWQAYL